MAGEDFETGYQAIGETSDEEAEDAPPGENIIHVVPDKNKARWNHIENLDDFFTRVYQYHQRSGFICMVVQDLLHLIQFGFVVIFSVFLLKCVDYQTLFYERWYNNSMHKVTIPDGIYSTEQCLNRFDPLLVICIVIAGLFWLFRLLQCIYSIFLYTEIRAFYLNALKISASELSNMTWHEVQQRLLDVQAEQEMCVHKKELNQLDIYHRILRFKNYSVAMTNKQLLPIKYRIPVLGNIVFLTTGLKYNLEMILFWGPWAPFENYWHLHADYRNYHKRKELAHKLSQRILLIGIANFMLMPVIMLWQILYSFFRYAEIIKREPGTLGMRRWSMYGRLYLRHFNELDHEFNARLNRGYKPAEKYMALFTSPLLTLMAKHLAFVSGAVLAVFVILTLVDEDFLHVEHVITVMTVLAAVLAVCRACIPDEHLVYCPEFLLKTVLGQIHYMPDSWKGSAHTHKVRDEFAQLYQYKLVYLLEELLSPLITPFILCFSFRHRALQVVDFLRNFSVEVTGVGDVCSFAQMDIRKHGNPQWVPEEATEASHSQQAEGGKTELSLMHFTLTNPTWRPPKASVSFMSHLKEQVNRDVAVMSLAPLENPLANSLHSMTSMGYTSLMSSGTQSTQPPQGDVRFRSSVSGGLLPSSTRQLPVLRGSGLKNAEGPVGGSTGPPDTARLLSSLQLSSNTSQQPSPTTTTAQQPPMANSYSHQGGGGYTSIQPFAAVAAANNLALSQSFSMTPLTRPVHAFTSSMGVQQQQQRNVDDETLEFLSMEMSFSALYMHELHHRRLMNPLNPYFDNEEDARVRALWRVPESQHQQLQDDKEDDEDLTSGQGVSLSQDSQSQRLLHSLVQQEDGTGGGGSNGSRLRGYAAERRLPPPPAPGPHPHSLRLHSDDIELHPLSTSEIPDIPPSSLSSQRVVRFAPTTNSRTTSRQLPSPASSLLPRTQGPYGPATGAGGGVISSGSGSSGVRSPGSPKPSMSDIVEMVGDEEQEDDEEVVVTMETMSSTQQRQHGDDEMQPLIMRDNSVKEL